MSIYASGRHTGYLWLTRVTRNSLPASARRDSTFGRGRGWGCRAVYELRSTLLYIAIIEHRSLNAIARGRIPTKIQHGHRPSFLCNRIYYGAWTAVPLYADRLL